VRPGTLVRQSFIGAWPLSRVELMLWVRGVTVQDAVWLRRFLQRLGVTAHAEDAILYSDSTLALVYAKDPNYHGNAKHIEFRYHYIRDMVSQGEVILHHICTSSMVADPLTKPIARDCSSLILKVWDFGGYDVLRYFIFCIDIIVIVL
jgi:hypothetical protein